MIRIGARICLAGIVLILALVGVDNALEIFFRAFTIGYCNAFNFLRTCIQ